MIFKGVLENSSYDLTTQLYNCHLWFSDIHVLSFTITIPIISNNLSVYYYKDSTINYALGKQSNRRYTTAVYAYPDGYLKAKGWVLDGDTALKAGTWRIFKPGQ